MGLVSTVLGSTERQYFHYHRKPYWIPLARRGPGVLDDRR